MSQQRRDYDSTVARIAGNIAAGLVGGSGRGWIFDYRETAAREVTSISVDLARRIVAEVKRTETAQDNIMAPVVSDRR